MDNFYTLQWKGDHLSMLDQRLLPTEETYLEYRSAAEVAGGIRDLVVRGAPAIGCAAAWGLAVAATSSSAGSSADLLAELESAREVLAASRPTAVNLFWALDRMMAVAQAHGELPVSELQNRLVAEAEAVQREDADGCRAMGRFGAELVPDGSRILTHCNAGALATADYGTALGVIRAARDAGKSVQVYADETRPILQGARLTGWELTKDDIPTTVIADNMAAQLMAKGEIDLVVVGSDRIAANGDVCNKIGTYGVAVLAKYHGIPFYVAAPLSTVDFSLSSGDLIPIEYRGEEEIRVIGERQMAPDAAQVRNPAFDVTPNSLVAAIVTERGIAYPEYAESLAELRDQYLI